jgi:hypothetical protein
VCPKSSGDDFSLKRARGEKPFPKVPKFMGADTPQQMSKPMPLKRRFRPVVGTKNFSLLSEYDYASLWSRWRRGYELSMYAQQVYKGINYSFKYYYSGVVGAGSYNPGYVYLYPTTRTDDRIWTVFVQQDKNINLKDLNLSVASVTDYSDTIYAVKLSNKFSLPISQLRGDTLSNKFTAAGEEKQFGYGNYAVVGIGNDGVLETNPDFTQLYNTLFLDHSEAKSWEVVDALTLRVPAASPPAVGEFLCTTFKAQCTCPDFVGRETVNLYDFSLKRRYPYTPPIDMKPGFFDAGSQSAEGRVINSIDNPGWSRGFGFIYLNQIFEIPSYNEQAYSDPSLFYFQPKWCKHIYAAVFDLSRTQSSDQVTSYYLPQPNDEPTHPAYREMFDRDLVKQTDFYERERDYRWWLRFGPTKEELPSHVLQPDTYNVFSKLTNLGTLTSPDAAVASGLTFLDVQSYDPFTPASGLDTYSSSRYASGILLTPDSLTIIDGGTYASGLLTSSFAYIVNGGTYS